jgi:hypothetical protein
MSTSQRGANFSHNRPPLPLPRTSTELTTVDCSYNPQWSTTATDSVATTSTTSTTATTATFFPSFHLHVAWAAGNTAQATAVANFKTAITTTGGASSSCTAKTDTSNYFCWSMDMNDYTASNKQDPFYNYEAFYFVGVSYIATAVQFGMRYRMADMSSTYGLDLLAHPNSGCPGNDHLRWSIFFQKQFPLSTCSFYFTAKCGFRRRLDALTTPLPSVAMPAGATRLVGEPQLVIMSHDTTGRANAPRALASSASSSTYSTSSCTSYANVASYTLFIIWNKNVYDDKYAKEKILAQFATVMGATRNSVSCATYTRVPSTFSATGNPIMCTEVNTDSTTNWFAAPYGYAPVIVPKAKFKLVLTWIMRNHDNFNMLSGATASESYGLPYMMVPNTGCTFLDFNQWSIRSPNFTVPMNLYPMQNPYAAFGSGTTVGTSVGDRVKPTSTTCTLSGWRIYAPFLLNNIFGYDPTDIGATTTAYDPKAATKLKTLLASAMTTIGTTYTSSYYSASGATTTIPLTTAYYKFEVTNTDAKFAKALKAAIMYHTVYSVDTTYSMFSQSVLLVRSTSQSACEDVNFLVYTGHTDVIEAPINREALSVTSYFGGRRAAAEPVAEAATEEPAAAAEPAERSARALAAVSCLTEYASDTLASWTLHITYNRNSAISILAAKTACSSLASSASATCPDYTTGTKYAYSSASRSATAWTMLGWTDPVAITTSSGAAAGLASTYSFAMNVPDAKLSQVLNLVMKLTSTTNCDIEYNLGWFLVPNLVNTGSCALSDVYTNFYMKQDPREYSVGSSSCTSYSASSSTTVSGITYTSSGRLLASTNETITFPDLYINYTATSTNQTGVLVATTAAADTFTTAMTTALNAFGGNFRGAEGFRPFGPNPGCRPNSAPWLCRGHSQFGNNPLNLTAETCINCWSAITNSSCPGWNTTGNTSCPMVTFLGSNKTNSSGFGGFGDFNMTSFNMTNASNSSGASSGGPPPPKRALAASSRNLASSLSDAYIAAFQAALLNASISQGCANCIINISQISDINGTVYYAAAAVNTTDDVIVTTSAPSMIGATVVQFSVSITGMQDVSALMLTEALNMISVILGAQTTLAFNVFSLTYDSATMKSTAFMAAYGSPLWATKANILAKVPGIISSVPRFSEYLVIAADSLTVTCESIVDSACSASSVYVASASSSSSSSYSLGGGPIAGIVIACVIGSIVLFLIAKTLFLSKPSEAVSKLTAPPQLQAVATLA